MPKRALLSYKFKKFIGQFFTRRLLGFYSGANISYFTSYFFAGQGIDQQGFFPSIIINIYNLEIHLHHWLLSSILLFFLLIPLFLKKKINAPIFLFTFGFSLGLIAQGVFAYSDWHEVLTWKIVNFPSI